MPWVEQSKRDLAEALEAIRVADIEKLGEIVERNALGMHETMHKAAPPVNYFTDKTYAVLNAVKDMRECGWPVWATMDAGPNVKVLTVGDEVDRVMEELRGRVEGELRGRVEGDAAGVTDAAGDSRNLQYEQTKFTVALPGDGVTIHTSLE